MEFSRSQVIDALRDAAESWWVDFPKEFRNADYKINFPAVRQQLLATCGVINSGIWNDQKAIARHFELLDDPEKQQLVDEALGVYGLPAAIR
jgi:hypothetical protein